MRKAITVALWLVAFAGCGDTLVRIDLPIEETTRSLIVAFEDRVGQREIFAVDPEDRSTYPFRDGVDVDGRIYALLYDLSFSELRLSAPGVLEPNSSGGRLPPPEIVRAAEIESEHAGEWKDLASAPEALLGRFAQIEPLCAQFEEAAVLRDGFIPMSRATIALADGDGQALVVTSTGGERPSPGEQRIYRVRRDGAEEIPLADLEALLGLRSTRIVIDIARSTSGRLWVLSPDALRVGTFSEGFQSVPERPSNEVPRALSLSPDGEVAFVLTALGTVERFDGSAWSSTPNPEVRADPELQRQLNDLQALDDDSAVVATGLNVLFRVQNGTTRREVLPTESGLNELALTPLGLLAVAAKSTETTLFLHDTDSWRTLAGPFPGPEIFAVAPFEKGFVIAGNNSGVQQYATGGGLEELCERQLVGPAIEARDLTPLGEGTFLMSGKATTSGALLLPVLEAVD